jgi:superfamily II DNA/RNA helicase
MLQVDLSVLDQFITNKQDVIVFTPTKKLCMKVWKFLKKKYNAVEQSITVAHSSLSDVWLTSEIDKWKSGAYFIMVATAVASNVRLAVIYIADTCLPGCQQEERSRCCALWISAWFDSIHSRGVCLLFEMLLYDSCCLDRPGRA